MQNIQADTAMRNSLSKAEEEKADKLSALQRKDSSQQRPMPQPTMPTPGAGFGTTSPFGQQMNPLAARFASLAAAQKRNNNNTDDNK